MSSDNKHTTFITTSEAYDNLGYRECYFTQNGLGDNLMLLAASEIYYKKYNKKLLLVVNHRELFENCDFCYVLSDFGYKDVQGHVDLEAEFININNYSFKINFLCVDEFIKYKSSDFLVSTYPKDTTMLAKICQRIGIEGEIEIDPKIYLTDEEKAFGNFYDNQITIISAGVTQYKSIDAQTVQDVVNELKDKFNFVHVGLKSDPLIENVKDLRGELSIRQIASVLYNSKMLICGIGGLMHLAKCVGCNSIVAYSTAESTNFYGYDNNKLILSDTPCYLCVNNEQNILYDACKQDYKCIKNISKDKIIDAVYELDKRTAPTAPKTVSLSPDKANGLEHYKCWLRRPPQIKGLSKKIFSVFNSFDRKSKIISILGFIFEIRIKRAKRNL